MDPYIDALRRAHAQEVDYFVRNQVGLRFRQSIKVVIRKPSWMPNWLYTRLMRTIVIHQDHGVFDVGPMRNLNP